MLPPQRRNACPPPPPPGLKFKIAPPSPPALPFVLRFTSLFTSLCLCLHLCALKKKQKTKNLPIWSVGTTTDKLPSPLLSAPACRTQDLAPYLAHSRCLTSEGHACRALCRTSGRHSSQQRDGERPGLNGLLSDCRDDPITDRQPQGPQLWSRGNASFISHGAVGGCSHILHLRHTEHPGSGDHHH